MLSLLCTVSERTLGKGGHGANEQPRHKAKDHQLAILVYHLGGTVRG